MRKILQISGVFLSFIFVLFGIFIMIALDLEIVSHPLGHDLPTWNVYYLDFKGSPIWFYIGCGMVSMGLTFLWLQRRKPN
jgi:hypothetical protein